MVIGIVIVFVILAFLPIFPNTVEAAVSCPAGYCHYNGSCYANGTTYGNYQCSNGSIIAINNASSGGATVASNNNYGSNNIGASVSAANFSAPSISISSGGASVQITNPTNKAVPLTLVTYKVYDNVLSHQKIFDYSSVTVAAHSSASLSADVASCMTQADLFLGIGAKPATAKEISSAVYTAPFCNDTPPPPPACTNCNPPPPPVCTDCNPPEEPDTLIGSCDVDPSSGYVGDSLSWSASASGGNGHYSYSWSGTDGLSSNSSIVSKIYSSIGIKTGTVTITSDGQSVSRTCSAVVLAQNIQNDLTLTCSASPSSVDVDEDVTWRAYPSGGTGSYSYDWSGTDDLEGSSRNITWSYDDNGTKRANVIVTSGGKSASASCSVKVNDDNNNDNDLSVSCYASPTTAQIGNRVNWYVSISGGDGDYDYDWSGTNGLNSSSRSTYKTYSSTGRKNATVTVTDGDGNEESDTCYVNINQNSVLAFSQTNQTPLVDAVYLNQIPYTGVADNYKLYSFVGILALLSAWIAYIIIARKKEVGELN